MSTIQIQDLAERRELDTKSMSAVRGGYRSAGSWFEGMGPAANVNVGVNVNQELIQVQNVNVEALNNVGVIGAGFGPFKLNVSPSQIGGLKAVF